MEDSTITQKDVETAIRIFHRVINGFKIPDEPTNEQAKEFLKEDGSIDFEKIPLRAIKTWDNGTKFLNLTYFYDGFLTVYADYNPVVAILDFIDSARKHFRAVFPQANVDDVEKWTEVEAVKMTFVLISRIYQRMDLAMRNYIDEVIHNWFIEWRRWEKTVNKEFGIKSPSLKEKEFFRNLLKTYEDDVVNLWFNVPDKSLDEKKIQLAKDYDSILNHWKKLRKEYSNGNLDWHEYAKAGKFFDTPDDLIDALEDCRNMSFLALEHAGRRAGLINPDMSKEDLEKRQQKIAVTGYSPKRLRDFKNEGDKLLKEMKK